MALCKYPSTDPVIRNAAEIEEQHVLTANEQARMNAKERKFEKKLLTGSGDDALNRQYNDFMQKSGLPGFGRGGCRGALELRTPPRPVRAAREDRGGEANRGGYRFKIGPPNWTDRQHKQPPRNNNRRILYRV
jgi:hypothetical protein